MSNFKLTVEFYQKTQSMTFKAIFDEQMLLHYGFDDKTLKDKNRKFMINFQCLPSTC